MNVPKNVLWFEVLLYLSLVLDALSVAFQDRTPSAQVTESTIMIATVMAACLIRCWFISSGSPPSGVRTGRAGCRSPHWGFR